MREDISDILRQWEFNPEANVRKIRGEDGMARVQVRVDQGAFQGILQVDLDGRPDGRKPHGEAFALDYYRRQAAAEQGAGDAAFALDEEACKELFDESARIYGRYVFLLQLKDYDRVVRDTERNMELFRFVHRYAETGENQQNLEKWWPYIIRIHATASAMLAVQDEERDAAADILNEAREETAALDHVPAMEFEVERERAYKALDELIDEIASDAPEPSSLRERLQKRLSNAVEHEDFELAARLRDQIKDIDRSEG